MWFVSYDGPNFVGVIKISGFCMQQRLLKNRVLTIS